MPAGGPGSAAGGAVVGAGGAVRAEGAAGAAGAAGAPRFLLPLAGAALAFVPCFALVRRTPLPFFLLPDFLKTSGARWRTVLYMHGRAKREDTVDG